MTYYRGFCGEYGAKYGLKAIIGVHAVGHGVPAAAHYAMQHFTNAASISVDHAIQFGLVGGGCGMMASSIAHATLNYSDVLSKKGIGLTRGGQIVRKVQLSAYTACIAVGLGVSAVHYINHNDPEQPVGTDTKSIHLENSP